MSRRGRLGIALAVAAGSLLCWQPVGAQTLRFPKRCRKQPVARPAPKVYIDSVTFAGDTLPPGLSQQQLVGQLRKRALDAGSKWLSQVRAAVRAAWRDRGYFQAVTSVQPQIVSSSDSERHVTLEIHADPGPLYRLDEVHILPVNPGQQLVFSRLRLRALVPLHPGQILDMQKAKDGLKAIKNLYASHGYIDFSAIPGFQIESEGSRVTLSYILDQGKQYRVGRVEILGLDPYLKPLLQARVAPGKPFDWSRVLDFYQTEKDALLPGVSPADDEVYRNPKTGKVDLVLDFRACPETSAGKPAGKF